MLTPRFEIPSSHNEIQLDLRYSYGVQAQLEWLSMLACRGAGAIALWYGLSKGGGVTHPTMGCDSPHPRISHLISLRHRKIGSMGMPIVALEPYTKSDDETFTDPHGLSRDSSFVGFSHESIRICFFPTHPTLH